MTVFKLLAGIRQLLQVEAPRRAAPLPSEWTAQGAIHELHRLAVVADLRWAAEHEAAFRTMWELDR